MPASKPVVWWIRRDLRLRDNPALVTAFNYSQTVIPVFVLDPALLNSPYHRAAEKRQAFLFGGLQALDDDLRARGARLIVRQGRPFDALAALIAETGASAIVATEDYSPYARRRDGQIAGQLPLKLVNSLTVHHPTVVVKSDGSPYTVFTPFKRAWRALASPDESTLLPAPARFAALPRLASVPIPQPQRAPHIVPEESVAQEALRSFVERAIFNYSEGRNRLDTDGTSALSAYLRFGLLSAREAVVAALQAIRTAPTAEGQLSAETWLSELIWREFYCAILYHFPHVLQGAFRPELRHIHWSNDPGMFKAWCEGRTGYPVVDAAMRQLTETGWMHNRARMITASFLVKDLLIDWRWGEQWFMQHLVDGDPAANNGGWQWTAGVGTDAAPYFRVFNPILQSQKFDPDGDYIRAWVTELRRVPDEYIHEPWKMPAEVQRQARCVIGQDYPNPIIDHAWARERVTAAYRQSKSVEIA